MDRLCSICGSPAPVAATIAIDKKRSQKSRAKTKNLEPGNTGKPEGVSRSSAESFCSAFGVPTDKFVPVLTNRKKTFCQGCYAHILAIDAIVKQIEELKMQLEWHRKEIEDNIRVRNLCRSNDEEFSSKMDYEIVDLMLLYFPDLVTIKTEVEESDPLTISTNNGVVDASNCFLPAVEIKQELMVVNVINTVGGDLAIASSPLPAAMDDNNFDDNLEQANDPEPASPNGRRLPRRNASAKAAKISKMLAQAVQAQEQLDPSSDEAECSDSDDYEPDTEPPAKKVKTGGKKGRSYEETESTWSGGGYRLTPKIIDERKKILKLMEEKPNITIPQMQRQFRSEVAKSFRTLGHKKKWRQEIEEFEKTVAEAAVGRCPRCVSGFKFIKTVRQHFMDMHPPRSNFICPTCEQALDSEESLASHSLLHVPTDKNVFRCVQCEKILPDLQSLRHHTWLHEFKQLHCGKGTCDKFYPTPYALAEHKCRKAPRNSVCEQCGMSFRAITSLAKHMFTHSDEKTFGCHLCPGWSVKSDFARVTHMRKVHGYHGPSAKYPPDVSLPLTAQAEDLLPAEPNEIQGQDIQQQAVPPPGAAAPSFVQD